MNNSSIIVAFSLILLSFPVYAEIHKCKNQAGHIEYTDKPCDSETQEEVSLGKRKKSSRHNPNNIPENSQVDENIQRNYIAYLDNLKTCKTSILSLKSSPFGEYKYTIVGKNNGRCHVTIQGGAVDGDIICNFSDETIALFTSDKKYQNIRNGNTYSTGNEETQRMSAECEYPQ